MPDSAAESQKRNLSKIRPHSLAIPALTALISVPLSWWLSDLHFVTDRLFYIGSAVVAMSLLLFSLTSW
jgi:hypothetical protein